MPLGLFKRRKKPEAPPPPPAEAPRPPAEDPAVRAARLAAESQVLALRRRLEEESRVASQHSALYRLLTLENRARPETDARGRYSLAALMDGEELPSREQRMWLLELDRMAAGLPQYSLKTAVARHAPDAPAEDPPPVDAAAFVRVAPDGLAAWLFLFPPLRGGARMRSSKVKEMLAQQNVKYGVANDVIEQACRTGSYLRLLTVATGKAPKDGEDGDIIDHFRRGFEIELKEKEDRTIDFHDLGWLQTVTEGEVICDVLPPVPPVDGVNVRGQAVQGRRGKKPIVPAGSGTRYVEEQQALVAAMDGVLSYVGGRFQVAPLLIVRGDVDNGVGNLDVVGSVLVHGDVRDGFEVRATADITVKGTVEGARLIAGGNIHVASGMNGGAGGMMDAEGDIRCVFIENASAGAGGTVYSATIVNSSVYAGNAVEALSGRGAIIGGSVTAFNRIEAKEIGHESNRSMMLNLGVTAAFVLEKRELMAKRNAMAAEVAEKEQSIATLEGRAERSWPEQQQLDELKMSLPVLKMQLSKLNGHLGVLNRKAGMNPDARLKAGVVYPPVELMVCGADATLRHTLRSVTVQLKGGQIVATEPSARKDGWPAVTRIEPKTAKNGARPAAGEDASESISG